MFVFSVITGSIQLLAAWGCYVLARGGSGPGVAAAVVLGLIDMFILGLSAPMPLVQGLVLLCIGFLFLALGCLPRSFVMTSSVVSVIVLISVGLIGINGLAATRAKYPFISMAPRLEYESKTNSRGDSQQLLANVAPDDLAKVDAWYNDGFNFYEARQRAASLEFIHDSQVNQFVNSPGFGVFRGMRPNSRYVDLDPRQPHPVSERPIPSLSRQTDDPSQQPLAATLPAEKLPRFETMHRESLVDFVNLAGFGYIRDRDHVAGFSSHAFRTAHAVPSTGVDAHWLVARLELVSLLKHEQPMVYVSENLPNMDELRSAPTRPLDEFERRTLQELMKDKQHVAAESTANRIRMLGAVRATQRCVVCHSVELGTLLGAFSYEFRRDPPIPERLPTQKPDQATF